MILPLSFETPGESTNYFRAFEIRLTIERRFIRRGDDRRIKPFRGKLTRIDVVAQISLKHFIPQVRAQFRIVNRTNNLDAAIEVAHHPVCAAYVNLFVAVVGEIDDPAVFEKPANDAANANVIRDAGHSGTQHANAANDEIDRNAGLGRFIKTFDNPGVSQPIELRDNARRATRFSMRGLAL